MPSSSCCGSGAGGNRHREFGFALEELGGTIMPKAEGKGSEQPSENAYTGKADSAPAESHNWLGAVERKHQVVRRALELFMDEEGGRNQTNLVKAAIYVPQQINSLSIHKGYTPTQWVMGKSTQTQIFVSEVFNPGIQPLDDQGTFARVQKRRLNA